MSVKIGGGYVEDKDHVPNPTDMVSTFNTSGLGAHQRIEEVSPIFEVDKVKTAEQIVAALDPKDTSVSSDRVLLPEATDDNETAKKTLLEAAKERASQDVVVGGPTPAEREAAEETDGEIRAEANAVTGKGGSSDSEKSDTKKSSSSK